MKKIIIIIASSLILIFISFFMFIYFNDNLRFKYEYEILNLFKYDNGKKIKVNIDKDNNIKYIYGKEVLNKLESKEETIIYFGYSDCPWCRSIISTLTDVVIENKIDNFYYVNVKKIDNFTISQIKIKLDDYLKINDEGIKTLYVPDVYFIKDGDIKYHYISNVDSVKNPYKKMNKEQINELKNVYQNGINMFK